MDRLFGCNRHGHRRDARVRCQNGKSALLNPEEQIKLLRAHNEELLQEQRILQQRRKYLTLKIQYWEAVAAGEDVLAADLAQQSLEIAKTFR